MANLGVGLLRDLQGFWKGILIILIPLAFLPLPLTVETSEAKCGYVLIVMAFFWMMELLPLPVTAFFPIFLFPMFGILDAKSTCANYLKDTNFLFVGGLIVAVAVEESNLHTRIALRVLLLMGTRPRWLMLGFMLVTAFLSMWISNTATTAMMTPIAFAVLENITTESSPETKKASGDGRKGNPLLVEEVPRKPSTRKISTVNARKMSMRKMSVDMGKVKTQAPFLLDQTQRESRMTQTEEDSASIDEGDEETVEFENLSKQHKNICRAVMLSICYSANIGGTGTLTGTGPNLVLSGQLDSLYPSADTGISFASWMLFAIPPLLIVLFFAWVWLQIAFLGIGDLIRACTCRKSKISGGDQDSVKLVLLSKYKGLGPMSFAEGSTVIWFLLLVALWIFRYPRFVPGWSELFVKKGTEEEEAKSRSMFSDACAAMLIGCILFAWPNQRPDFCFWRRDPNQKPKNRKSLVTWPSMQQHFPWGVIMLLGGGFALAHGVKESKLSEWVGCTIQNVLGDASPKILLIVFTILSTFITEISSNTATASIFIPIMLSAAENYGVNPLYFALPATIAPSFAFMLPVATPPNAIVYDTGVVRIVDMMWAGFVMNWICIAVTLINIETYGTMLFSLGTYPSWGLAATGGNISSCG